MNIDISPIVTVILSLIVLKSLIIGSEFNFFLWLLNREDYWEWYANRQTYSAFKMSKMIVSNVKDTRFFLIENIRLILAERDNKTILLLKQDEESVKIIVDRMNTATSLVHGDYSYQLMLKILVDRLKENKHV